MNYINRSKVSEFFDHIDSWAKRYLLLEGGYTIDACISGAIQYGREIGFQEMTKIARTFLNAVIIISDVDVGGNCPKERIDRYKFAEELFAMTDIHLLSWIIDTVGE